MRALLITVGSRGDAEPFCSLARALGAKGHNVDLLLQTDLKQLAPPSASVHDLPFTQMDFYKFVGNPSHGADHQNPRVRFIGIVTDIIAELILPCTNSVLEVAKDCQVIVTSSLARPLAMAVSQKVNVPMCVVHLQPLAPTDRFPHFSQTELCVSNLSEVESDSDARFEESYWELEKFQHDFLQDRLDEVYTKLQLQPLRFDDAFKKALVGTDGGKTFIANAFSDEVIPSVHGEHSAICDVGPLADDYIPEDWSAPEDLVAFLNCETPPVCIGYGSMPFDKAFIVLEALEELGRKAILVCNALKATDRNEWANENVFHISSAPYPWLLPQCSMMLSHGGAGVVNATLRAGIPCVVSPFMGDQFFYAKLLEAKKLGVQAGANLGSLTKEDLVDGIRRADSIVAEAKGTGENIRSKKAGVDRLVAAIEQRCC